MLYRNRLILNINEIKLNDNNFRHMKSVPEYFDRRLNLEMITGEG